MDNVARDFKDKNVEAMRAEDAADALYEALAAGGQKPEWLNSVALVTNVADQGCPPWLFVYATDLRHAKQAVEPLLDAAGKYRVYNVSYRAGMFSSNNWEWGRR